MGAINAAESALRSICPEMPVAMILHCASTLKEDLPFLMDHLNDASRCAKGLTADYEIEAY